jgi:hypothetical protein
MTEIYNFRPKFTLPSYATTKSLINPDKSAIKGKEIAFFEYKTLNEKNPPGFTAANKHIYDFVNNGDENIACVWVHCRWTASSTPTKRKLLMLTLLQNISVKLGSTTFVNIKGRSMWPQVVSQIPKKENLDKIIELAGGDAAAFVGTTVYDYYFPLICVPGSTLPPYTGDTSESYPIHLHQQFKKDFIVEIINEPIANCFSAGTAESPEYMRLEYISIKYDDKYKEPIYKTMQLMLVDTTFAFSGISGTKVGSKIDGVKVPGGECIGLNVNCISDADNTAYNWYNNIAIKAMQFKNGNKILYEFESVNESIFQDLVRKDHPSYYTIGSTTYKNSYMNNASMHSSYSDLHNFSSAGFTPANIQDFQVYIDATSTATIQGNAVAIYKCEIELSEKGVSWRYSD